MPGQHIEFRPYELPSHSVFTVFSVVHSSMIPARRPSGVIARGACLAVLLALGGSAVAAQDAHCFGFSFGAWQPPLDLKSAGHGQPLPPGVIPKAPGGRDWASDGMPNDTTLMLYPEWWPAGIQVTFPRRPGSPADTVAARAVALVADGGATPPRASARLWRVPCR
jgi:hypothetical protein